MRNRFGHISPDTLNVALRRLPLDDIEHFPVHDMRRTDRSRSMPARRGHEVCVLLLGELVVGLVNLSTGRRVNFVRADPPLLLRRCDVLAAVGILVAGAILAASWDVRSLLLTVPFGLLYVPCKAFGRLLWRTQQNRQVDRGLDMALAAASAEPPRLWRVK